MVHFKVQSKLALVAWYNIYMNDMDYSVAIVASITRAWMPDVYNQVMIRGTQKMDVFFRPS